MANPEHLAILKNGPEAWNEWRRTTRRTVEPNNADLGGADLRKMKLMRVEFDYTSLEGANLDGADLRDAYFIGSDLNGASLRNSELVASRLYGLSAVQADFTGASLLSAQLGTVNFSDADFTHANFNHTILESCLVDRANFSEAVMSRAVLCDIDFSHAQGLDICQHVGPSSLDYQTLQKSRGLPLKFLRGCGVSETFINYLPSLQQSSPIQFYSCFISHATAPRLRRPVARGSPELRRAMLVRAT
jgi:uncharacterized protein YjbI with pentapeptide repeats